MVKHLREVTEFFKHFALSLPRKAHSEHGQKEEQSQSKFWELLQNQLLKLLIHGPGDLVMKETLLFFTCNLFQREQVISRDIWLTMWRASAGLWLFPVMFFIAASQMSLGYPQAGAGNSPFFCPSDSIHYSQAKMLGLHGCWFYSHPNYWPSYGNKSHRLVIIYVGNVCFKQPSSQFY